MNKEFLIQEVAALMQIDEDIVNKVISFQGEDALRAVKIHDEIEYSGFGKFYLSQSKLKKRINSLEKILESLQKDKVNNYQAIGSTSKTLENLKIRLK